MSHDEREDVLFGIDGGASSANNGKVPDFVGNVEPTVFSDWLASIKWYSDWYDMADDRRVRFAKMKFVGFTKVWWTGVENDIRRLGQPPIGTWQEMKAKLREMYVPANYRD